jgi:hypothetical protein
MCVSLSSSIKRKYIFSDAHTHTSKPCYYVACHISIVPPGGSELNDAVFVRLVVLTTIKNKSKETDTLLKGQPKIDMRLN